MASDSEDAFVEALSEALRRAEDSAVQVDGLYDLLRRQKRLRGHLLAEMRCRSHGCLLAHVFNTPKGVAVHFPRHKRSPGKNLAESAAEARAEQTVDNQQRVWRSRSGLLADFVVRPPAEWVTLQQWRLPVVCDHVDTLVDESIAPIGEPGRPTHPRITNNAH